MINHRRRNFRPRPQKNNFRRRNGSVSTNNGSNFNNGNLNFNRNGSMTNPHNVEKTMQKFQLLAKDNSNVEKPNYNNDTAIKESPLTETNSKDIP